MILHPELKPKLRPVEPGRGAQPGTLTIGDPSRLSPNTISLTEPAFFILTLLDGEHTLADVQQTFQERYGQPLAFDTLAQMVTHLEESLLLEGPGFEAHYRTLVERYRAAPARTMNGADALGVDGQAGDMFREMLGEATQADCSGRIVGLIAPHLDYPRGRPCYAEAYAALANQPRPDRVVILGTNHFGLGGRSSVVATGMDFATPLGTTATDRAFLERLEADCGDLRRYEYDHANEHSIELQVCWLQHLFGAEAFQMVGLLCPDPCGPTGTAPYDGHGVDLADFARALGAAIADDSETTLVIAGADFSHVGQYFGDAGRLDDAFLDRVRQRDRSVLERIEQGDREAFRACVAQDQNPTRICSAGCMYALMSALPDGRARTLGYHQAVTKQVQNCVTCAAVVFTQ